MDDYESQPINPPDGFIITMEFLKYKYEFDSLIRPSISHRPRRLNHGGTRKMIQEEADYHGDMILVPMMDTYRNLPIKLIKGISQ